MTLTVSQKLDALQTVVKKEFDNGLKSGIEAARYNKIATEVPSSSKSNTYDWVDLYPFLEKWEDTPTFKSLRAHSYTIVNDKWRSGIEVLISDIEDDSYGYIKQVAADRGNSVQRSHDRGILGLLKTGDTIACMDGQNFFDSEHPYNTQTDGSGSTKLFSNLGAGSGTPWYLLCTKASMKPLILQVRVKPQLINVTGTDSYWAINEDKALFTVRARHAYGYGLPHLAYKSQAELTPDNLHAAVDAMGGARLDGGVALDYEPDTLVVPRSMRAKAVKLIERAQVDGTDNELYKSMQVIVSSHL